MKKRIQPILYPSFFFLIFAFLFLWFSRIHPLIPFDADDWTYLGYIRPAVPIWGAWNPSRVFPEVALPFFSKVASYLVMPLTGDYITAQTLMHAFVVSAFTTVYLGCFACLLRRCFPISRPTASLLTALF